MKRLKLPLLYLSAFLLSVMPILVYFTINSELYFKTRGETVKLLFGGALAIGIVIFKTLGFLKIKSSIVIFLGVFVFSYLLESVISDLIVFSFLALAGELGSSLVKIFIAKEKGKIRDEKTEEIVEKAILKSSGRV